LHVQIPKKQLSDALGHLERVVPSRSANAALTHVRLAGTDRGLYLTGTNLEIDLEVFVAAEVHDPSTFTVPAHLLGQVVRSLPGELVELTMKGTELTIASGGSTFRLASGELEAFPTIEFPTSNDVTLDAKELAKSISAVRYAAAAEEFRAIFRGVQLELTEKRSRVVATDGFRLAYRDFAGAGAGNRKLVIPARNADELVRVLREGEARLAITPGTLTVESGNNRVNVKLMDGELPDYERVIPSTSQVRVTLEADTLRDSVARVAVVADKLTSNRVDFIVSGGRLQLVAESDYGRAQDVLEVAQEGSEPGTTIGFRARQLLDALGPMDGDVTIDLGASGAPAVFRCTADPNYLAIVVSLRV
jgi:DNA polymerase-3 subunit beta